MIISNPSGIYIISNIINSSNYVINTRFFYFSESQKEPDKVVPLSEVTFFSASGSEFEPADSDPDDSDFELKSKQVKIKRKPLHKKVKKSYREENSLQSDSDCDHYISGKTKGW